MTGMALVIGRFAGHELAIRRLYLANQEFRAVCEDYATAVRARERWSADGTRAEEYRLLVEELEDEILQALLAGGGGPEQPLGHQTGRRR